MPTVHVRITGDDAQPTPVRLHVGSADGRWFAPLGYPLVFPTGIGESPGPYSRIEKENWYAVPGSFEIDLPAGVPLRFRALKGPAYVPLDERITLTTGQLTLRLAMRRWHRSTWQSVDTRIHFDSPHDVLLQAQAEDVSQANLLIREHPVMSQDGRLYPVAAHLSAFSGQAPITASAGHAVTVNTFNAHPSLGHLGLLHTHRPVFPLSFGEWSDDWTLGDWCDQAHRKRGLTIWAHAFRPSAGLLGGDALAAAILGQVDAIEWDPKPRTQPLLPWIYRLWNAGIRLPLVAGSGRESNSIPVGAMRTFIDGEWTDAIRAGRTFISNGPIVSFHADERSFEANAVSVAPFDELEVIHNGSVIASAPAVINTDGRWSASVSRQGEMSESGWLAARTRGNAPSLLYPPMPVLAHTSAIGITVPGKPFAGRGASLPLLRQCLDDTRRWIEESGRFVQDKFRHQLQDRCARAMTMLERDDDPPTD